MEYVLRNSFLSSFWGYIGLGVDSPRYESCGRFYVPKFNDFFLFAYNISLKIAKKLDLNGFVVDFSSLKPLENRLKEQFDHTFLINKDDPLLNYWEKLHDLDALDLRIMDNVGMEFTSELIWRWANEYLQDKDKGRTCCWKTESKENKSNKASYEEIPDWFKS